MKTPVIYQFEQYTFRQGGGLRRDGLPVPLPPRESALLSLLLKRHGEVVSYEDIETGVWPEQEVAYSSLARLVHSLRVTLGGDRNAFITTVSKRGYRFDVPVRVIDQKKISPKIADSVATDSRTFAHFLEGQREANRGQFESQARAVRLFQKALDRDPAYAPAALAMGDVHVYQVLRGYLIPDDGMRLATVACQKALAIDPTSLAAICIGAWFDGAIGGNLERACAKLEEATRRDPEYAQGHIYHSFILRALGRVDEGVEAAQRAVTVDPHALITSQALAWSLFCAGRATEAMELNKRIVMELPHVDVAQAFLAIFAAWLGEFQVADRACDALVASHSSNVAMMTAAAYALACKGEVRDALALTSRLEAPDPPRAPRTQLAAIYVAAGDHETAFKWLRRAKDGRCPWSVVAPVDPRFEVLKNSKEFQSLYDNSNAGREAPGASRD